MDINDWLKQASNRSTALLRAAVGLGTGSGLLLLIQAWLLADIVDAIVFRHRSLIALMPLLWGLLAVFAVRAFIAWAVEWVAFRAAAHIKLQVRKQLLEHVLALGPVRVLGERSGELANIVTDGVEALEAYYSRFLPQMALAVLVPLAILALVFPLDWISGLVLLVTAPVIPLMMVLIGKGAEALNQRQWRQLARLSAHFLDTLQGLTTLKLFNASRREAAVVARLSDDYRKSTMAVLRIAFLSSLALEFLATVSIALVAVLIGFRLLWGELDFRSGFLILLLAPEFYMPLRALGAHYHARMDAIGAAERMVELLATPVQTVSGGIPFPHTSRLHIQVRDVRFAYEPGHPALDGLSFQIEHGEHLALVGPSGAGKTTVINLLLGFVHPSTGEVLINNRALRELNPDDWLHHVAWIPQHPRILHGTILENIRLGRPDADLHAVRKAARVALAEEFIEDLPQGYHTLVGEGGQGLSGGQAQRLALARAFLKDAPLVLLDEPSANLDLDSERKLGAAIDHLAAGRTTVTIAHRLNTVRQSDRILVLERGRLIEAGSHVQLVERGGLYRQLVYASEVGR